MGTILASKIVDDAEDILTDSGNGQWAATRLFKYFNIVQRAVVLLKPDASVTRGAVVLVAGVRQTVPTGGLGLNRVIRNMGTNGTTPGAAITFIEMDVLSACIPDWNTATASATVVHYMWDERDPLYYYVYPPQPTSAFGYVDISYPVLPANVAAMGNAITLDDIYEPALIEGLCYYAYLEDAAHSLYAQERAQWHWNQFVTLLGRKDLVEESTAPKPIRISTENAGA